MKVRWECPECGQKIANICKGNSRHIIQPDNTITCGYIPEDPSKEVRCPRCGHEF